MWEGKEKTFKIYKKWRKFGINLKECLKLLSLRGNLSQVKTSFSMISKSFSLWVML
jgi:hypothetical protein